MPKYTIRNQIMEKLLDRRGECYRLACETGIDASTIWEWAHRKRGRRLGDEQLDALAAARGMVWMLVPAEAGQYNPLPEPPRKVRTLSDSDVFPH